jgi:hypothetical protein
VGTGVFAGGCRVGVTPATTAAGPTLANPINRVAKSKTSPNKIMILDPDIRDSIVLLTSRLRVQFIQRTASTVPRRTVQQKRSSVSPSCRVNPTTQ